MQNNTTILSFFEACFCAVRDGKLIHRESRLDKEFHFQNWVKSRLDEIECHYDIGGRNSYPDFRIVATTEGYEVKGLAYPGRELNYDCNSQIPSGFHNGRTIFYVFGRYPSTPDGESYPVLDLVICHGDFLNTDREYVHKNKSFKGFGSYGDIMVRDRKMYVAPTPYGLLSGLAHTQTMILPKDYPTSRKFKLVGELVREEADKMIIGYDFDLRENILTPKFARNQFAGTKHNFSAWRFVEASNEPVSIRGKYVLDTGESTEEDTNEG